MPTQNAIRQRAYEIWEQEGRPKGRAEEHWRRAQAELNDREGIRGPTPDDLERNPGIGTSAGTTPEGLEAIEGENTFEGDVLNDTTPTGGINPDQRGRENK